MNNKIPEYEIKYSKIKNIYIQIKNGKIIVKAPKRVSKKEIEKIVEQKTEWIQKTIEKENKNKNVFRASRKRNKLPVIISVPT